MKKLSFLSAICAGLLMSGISSCASYQKEAAVMSMDSHLNTYLEADVDYSSTKPIQATVNTATLFGFIQLKRNGHKYFHSANRYKGLTKRQSQALYRAKEDSGADIIAEPEFEMEKHSWFFGAYTKTSTKVKGWGLKVNGIKEDKHLIANF